MANNVKLGAAAANAEAGAIVALCNTGYLRLYDGSQPATADTAVSAQTLIAELRFAATAMSGSPAAGVATFAAVTADSSANATGTPTWFRALKSDGSTAVFDGTAGESGTDCIIDSVPIAEGGTVSVTAMTYTAHRG